MNSANVGEHANVGMGDIAKQFDFTGDIKAHFQDGNFMFFGQVEQGER